MVIASLQKYKVLRSQSLVCGEVLFCDVVCSSSQSDRIELTLYIIDRGGGHMWSCGCEGGQKLQNLQN